MDGCLFSTIVVLPIQPIIVGICTYHISTTSITPKFLFRSNVVGGPTWYGKLIIVQQEILSSDTCRSQDQGGHSHGLSPIEWKMNPLARSLIIMIAAYDFAAAQLAQRMRFSIARLI